MADAPEVVWVAWCATCGVPIIADRQPNRTNVSCHRCREGIGLTKWTRYRRDPVKPKRKAAVRG